MGKEQEVFPEVTKEDWIKKQERVQKEVEAVLEAEGFDNVVVVGLWSDHPGTVIYMGRDVESLEYEPNVDPGVDLISSAMAIGFDFYRKQVDEQEFSRIIQSLFLQKIDQETIHTEYRGS